MTENKIRIGIFFGGRSGEHEVSLMSARSVLSVLSQETYRVIPIGITHNGEWRIHPADLQPVPSGELPGKHTLEALEANHLQDLIAVTILPDPSDPWLYLLEKAGQETFLTPASRIDVAFPVIHGSFGEDGTLQGLFEVAGIPYVGAGVLASSVGMDKALFKDVMEANGVPVLPSLVFSRKEISQNLQRIITEAEALAPYPLFTKPANMGSSVGITKCHNRSDLIEGLIEAARYDRRIMVERGINAREIEVSVLGNESPQASIPGEIIPSDEFYSYRAKYLDNASELIIPAPIPFEISEQARQLAIKAYTAVDCAGMARVDFLIDKNTNALYLNEINTIPGFTKISMYPKLWEASGLPYPALIDRLIQLAVERQEENEKSERVFRRSA